MYEISEIKPTVSQWQELRRSVGWIAHGDDESRLALENTLFCVCAKSSDGRLAGMARVAGDGVTALQIHDVIVHPDFHGEGIGTQLMERVLEYIDMVASEYALVSLMSMKGMESFYERLGFIRRPTEDRGCGMMYIPRKDRASGVCNI